MSHPDPHALPDHLKRLIASSLVACSNTYTVVGKTDKLRIPVFEKNSRVLTEQDREIAQERVQKVVGRRLRQIGINIDDEELNIINDDTGFDTPKTLNYVEMPKAVSERVFDVMGLDNIVIPSLADIIRLGEEATRSSDSQRVLRIPRDLYDHSSALQQALKNFGVGYQAVQSNSDEAKKIHLRGVVNHYDSNEPAYIFKGEYFLELTQPYFEKLRSAAAEKPKDAVQPANTIGGTVSGTDVTGVIQL